MPNSSDENGQEGVMFPGSLTGQKFLPKTKRKNGNFSHVESQAIRLLQYMLCQWANVMVVIHAKTI